MLQIVPVLIDLPIPIPLASLQTFALIKQKLHRNYSLHVLCALGSAVFRSSTLTLSKAHLIDILYTHTQTPYRMPNFNHFRVSSQMEPVPKGR